MKTTYELALPTTFAYRVDAVTEDQLANWVGCALGVDVPTRLDPVLAVTVAFVELSGAGSRTAPIWRLWLGAETYARLRDELGAEIADATTMIHNDVARRTTERNSRVVPTAPHAVLP